MANSAGNAEAEMSVITDSIEYKTNRLKETAVGIAQDIFQRDSTKQMVDNLTSLLEVINSLTKSVGGLGTAFTGLMAYKGLRGQGIFNIFGAGKSSINGIKNFFTQPILSQKGIDLGLTQDSIQRLSQYNNLIKQNVSITSAYHQTMRGADDATKLAARSIANGSVQMNELTMASKAAAVGMNILKAAMNIGVSLAISFVVKQVYELAHAYESVAEKADNAIAKLQERKDENNQLQELIDKYKELKEAETSENKQETRKQTLELQKEITNLIAKQPDLYNKQLKNIDLVNGKLDEQLGLLGQINQENSKSVIKSAANAYRDAADAAQKYKYDVKGGQIGGKNIIWLDGETENGINDANGQAIIDELLKRKFVGNSNWGVDSSGRDYYNIEFAENTNWIQRLKFLDEAIEALEQSAEFDTSQKGLYDQLLDAREDINKVVGKEIQAATDYAQLLTESSVQTNMADIGSYGDFAKARKEILDELSNDGTIKKALIEGALSDEDINDYVDEYISTLNNLSDYYDEWVRRNTNNYENMTDAEKAWAAEQSQHVKSASFAYEDYKDQIEEVEKSVSTLSSAYQKLDDGSITTSDLGSLFKEFPDLVKYSDDTETLKKKIKELNNQNVTNLIKSFVELKSKISDPEQLKQLDGWINYLLKLSDLSTKVSKQVSSADYVKYEEKNIQDIIDKLEKEKDNQNDILDNLKAQKEELENIISQYKQVVDVVTDYIDKSQIEPLEQRKSDVEEYYNAQIEALKAENEERDRNIELQKAQDALANARKTKVRIYNETQDWHTEFDTNAIKNAENELSGLQNEIAIDDFEKQRDSEVKGIEEQIEAWENYKEQWKEQVEQITKADEELTASKILGADWHEKIASQDINVMVNFGSQYQSYNNRLNNQVNVEISNLEKAIKSRENEIAEWKDYKTQLSDINTSITESNDTYLQTLNQFVIDENSTWEQRIEHMRRNAQIIAELNRQASEVPEIDAESALTGSNLWGIARDGNVLKLYASESEAKADKENIVKDLVRKQIAPGMPSDVIETITKRIMESLEIKQYARGGINTNTGLAWLDGTNSNSEVIFNSAQAKQLYDIVRNGNYGEMISKNILNNINNQSALSARENANKSQVARSINISFPNATINAKDYDSFKGFMDRYTNDLLLKMQVGL